jgi:hypothetical protein
VALLLIIDLLFLPWFSATVSVGPISASFTASATSDPDGWLGILSVLSALLLIVDLGIERFSPSTTIPNIGGSRTQTRFVLACVAAAFVVLKFLFHIHFSLFGFGFYLAIVLAAALVWVAFQTRNGASVVGNIHVGR